MQSNCSIGISAGRKTLVQYCLAVAGWDKPGWANCNFQTYTVELSGIAHTREGLLGSQPGLWANHVHDVHHAQRAQCSSSASLA
jgi:hypothetical protein